MNEHFETVVIYHNVQQDAEGHLEGFFGYKPEHAVTPVFTYVATVEGAAFRAEAEHAFAMLNSYPEEMHTGQADLPTVRRYRASRLRSLSVGDVVKVGNSLFAVARVGMDFLGYSATVAEENLNIQPNPFDNFTGDNA